MKYTRRDLVEMILAVEIAQEFENLGLMAEDENGEWELKF